MKWLDKKDELRELIVEQKLSYVEIGRRYGVSGTYIKKAARQLGIPITSRRKINPSETFGKGVSKLPEVICLNCGKSFKRKFTGYNKFCCFECSTEFRKNKSIEDWRAGIITGTSGFNCTHFVRDYMLKKVNYKCEICGWGEENPYTHKVPLQIHHIDGNSLNNIESNLQVLCPNCHSLTENFGSKNKNAPNGKSHYYRRA